MRRNLLKRWLYYMLGLIILAFGVALTIKGQMWGLGSWDVLHYGLYLTFGLTVGSWAIIVGIIIVLVTSIYTREWPRLGVYVNLFLVGTFIDIFLFLLPDVEGVLLHSIVYVLGVLVLAFGIATYISPNLGAGPRDTLMLIISDTFNLRISTARNVMELFAAVSGFLLGGPVFIGTLFIVLFLGRLIEWMLPYTRGILVQFLGEEDPNIIQLKPHLKRMKKRGVQ